MTVPGVGGGDPAACGAHGECARHAVHRALSRLVSPFAAERGVGDDFKIFLEVPEDLGPHSGAVTSADLLKNLKNTRNGHKMNTYPTTTSKHL